MFALLFSKLPATYLLYVGLGLTLSYDNSAAYVLSNFSFRHYVFKKLSAAEASESVYMRERVKLHG